MAKGTMDVEFAGASGSVLRFLVTLLVREGDEPASSPMSVQRFDGNKPAKATRMALVGGPPKFSEIRAAPIGSSEPFVFDLPPKPVAFAGGGFRWQVFVETDVGKSSTLVIKHKLANDSRTSVSVPPPQKNTAAPVKQALDLRAFPRLILGLTKAPATSAKAHQPSDDPVLGHAKDLAALLKHVHSRLVTPAAASDPTMRPDALEDAWRSQRANPIEKQLPDGAVIARAEELWARRVTEMLLLTPYGGPGVHYFGDGKDEHVLLADAVDGSAGPGTYPLIFACQHLASFGVATRGRAQHRFPPGFPKGTRRLLNAGSGSAGLVNQMGGKWVIGGNPPAPIAGNTIGADALKCDKTLATANTLYGITDIEGRAFAPGSVFVFSNRAPKSEVAKDAKSRTQIEGAVEVTYTKAKDKPGETPTATWRINGNLLADNTAGAHTGFVLRTDPTIEPKVYQTFDTGGFSVAARGDGVDLIPSSNGFHTGNFDDPATNEVKGKDPFRGVGIWTKMTVADARALVKHVETVLEKARPLGLARIVVVDRQAKFKFNEIAQSTSGGRVAFASPLLRMYDDDDVQNYSIARLIWSLRGTPCRGTKVLWFVYLPNGPLAHAMKVAHRNEGVAALAAKALAGVKSPKTKLDLQKKPDQTIARVLAKYTLPILDIEASGADPTVRVTYKYPKTSNWHKLHFAERPLWDGRLLLPMDEALGQTSAAFPPYFTKT